VKVAAIRTNIGAGLRKFTLSYAVPTDLAPGLHTVLVKIHDLHSKNSSFTWRFTVGGAAPVTTTDAQMNYVIPSGSLPSAFVITLTALNNGGGHTYYMLDGGAQTTYVGPIPVPTPGVTPSMHTLEYWSVNAAGTVETHHTFTFFVQLLPRTFAQNHASPTSLGLICTTSGCHDSDLWTIHADSDAATTVAGIEYVGCALCHNTNPAMPATTNNCITCHGALVHGDHVVIASSGATSLGDCARAGCHPGNAVTQVHASCATCHGSANAVVIAAVEAGGHATCETCHAAGTGVLFPSHTALDAHALGGGACFGSTACHAYTDAAAFHMGTPSGCSACHVGTTAHTVSLTVGWANRCALVGCHPNLDATHDTVFGFFNASNASSHGAGVRTMFDGSQGIVLKDTLENTVTTEWDFPQSNVFWASNDASAPPTAIKGLNEDSVVTCFDCHSGDVNWFTGPHGASARWAIDANYPYPFKYAILGGGAGANSATNYSLNVKAEGSSQTTGAATPATVSAGVPASASGIKARIAANLGTVASPIRSTTRAPSTSLTPQVASTRSSAPSATTCTTRSPSAPLRRTTAGATRVRTPTRACTALTRVVLRATPTMSVGSTVAPTAPPATSLFRMAGASRACWSTATPVTTSSAAAGWAAS
jgi:hypothetical protein